ncbi:helicase-related protein, partial [uncultured Chryseobacterium sp.]|uniref:RecQ family ATP-dependent DNA helicase n=1 Tax=uncultured Chryseobacterium sp. TaxID=259322 RepID=UPI00260853FE
IFRKSFRRENIKISCEKLSDKYSRIYNLLKYNCPSGIIYTRTRHEAEKLSNFLKNKGLNNVDYYHAGLSSKERHQKQNLWLKSDRNVLISTNAFGMGIDKENVRFVIHLSPSASIENYYQEIGRAGRDGAESYAFLFWDEQELKNIDNILHQQIPSKEEFLKIITYIYSTFQVAENDLPENIFQLERQRIQNFTKCSSAKINNVLNFLHHQELIYFNSMKSLSTLELKMRHEEIDLLPKKDSHFIELLLRSLSGISSHKVFFSENNLSNKLGIDALLIKERIKEVAKKGFVEYIDGRQTSIKFLKHRNDHLITGKYWKIFEQIQRNKIHKWEELKYYIKDEDYCKNRLILSYFGEKNAKDCGKCSVCERKKDHFFDNRIVTEIVDLLSKRPSTLEEISAQLNFHKKEKILEELINLLDSGKIKMLNFRTYTLA